MNPANQSAWNNYNTLRPQLGAIYEMTPAEEQIEAQRGKPRQPRKGPRLVALEPGEMKYGDWRRAEGARRGVSQWTIKNWIRDGVMMEPPVRYGWGGSKIVTVEGEAA